MLFGWGDDSISKVVTKAVAKILVDEHSLRVGLQPRQGGVVVETFVVRPGRPSGVGVEDVVRQSVPGKSIITNIRVSKVLHATSSAHHKHMRHRSYHQPLPHLTMEDGVSVRVSHEITMS